MGCSEETRDELTPTDARLPVANFLMINKRLTHSAVCGHRLDFEIVQSSSETLIELCHLTNEDTSSRANVDNRADCLALAHSADQAGGQ